MNNIKDIIENIQTKRKLVNVKRLIHGYSFVVQDISDHRIAIREIKKGFILSFYEKHGTGEMLKWREEFTTKEDSADALERQLKILKKEG